MKANRICAGFLVLIMVCGILPCALAEQPESPSISVYDVFYTQNGFLYGTFDGSMIYYYDWTTGQRRLLCNRPGCDHKPAGEINPNDFHFSTEELMNGYTSLCYAAKFSYASSFMARAMYGNKLYFFPTFYDDTLSGTNPLPLYVSETDGETRMLTDLGCLFSEPYDPYAVEVLVHDGYLYYEILLYGKPVQEEEEAIDPEPGLPFGSIQLVRCSMDTGEATILETFSAESNEFHFLISKGRRLWGNRKHS